MAAAKKRGRKARPQSRRKALAPRLKSAALVRGGERFELALSAINEGVYDWDVANGTIYYSEAVYSVLHVPRSVKTPGDWRKRIHPDDIATYDAAIVAHFKKKTRRFECDYRYRVSDRSWRWARQHGIAQRDARGRVVRMIGSTGDITELKRVELALAESRERYALATSAATEGIYEWNLETGALYLSDRSKAFFAIKGDALTPATWNKRVHREDFPGYREAIVEYFKGRAKNFEHEYRIRNAEGGYSWVVDRAVAVRNKAGQAIRLVGALSNITQHKLHEIELSRARDEATEALERQTATAEVLASISGSMTDAQPVFDAIVRSINRLFGTRFAVLQLLRDGMVEMPAVDGAPGFEKLRERYPRPLDATTVGGQAMLTKQAVQYAPVLKNPATPVATIQFAKDFGFDSVMFTPMIHEGKVVGAIGTAFPEPKPFDARQVALIKTFADQAVIAIENVRLFNETKEALERQTATAEILKIIASSPSDVQPVFDAIAKSSIRLFGGHTATVTQVVDKSLHLAAFTSPTDSESGVIKGFFPRPISSADLLGKAVLSGKPEFRSDIESDTEVSDEAKEVARIRGYRSLLAVPMLRESACIGTISVSRREPGAFSNHLIELLKTFADQAVIAIENVRLFNETREALERQTATAEILKVIASSPADVQPVFDAIAASAKQLLNGGAALVARRAGDMLHLAAFTTQGEAADAALLKLWPSKLVGQGHMGQAVLNRGPVLISDIEIEPGYSEGFRAMARTRGLRSIVSVPMLREGEAIGVISVNRPVAGRFSEHQTNLLRTFADQAVIAIENVRLFNETKEALERQTATSEVLRVISQSQTDTGPVFDAIIRSAVRLCAGTYGSMVRVDGDMMHLWAHYNYTPEAFALVSTRYPAPVTENSLVGLAVRTGKIVHSPDRLKDARSRETPYTRALGIQAQLTVPLLKDGSAIGTLNVLRKEAGAFTEEQIGLLQTFADQAVIAIENVRLFNETKEALERQTATADILKVIASSPSDIQPVFDAIAESAKTLLGGMSAVVTRVVDDRQYLAAYTKSGVPGDDAITKLFPAAVGAWNSGRAIVTRAPAIRADTETDREISAAGLENARARGYRSLIAVPMLRGDKAIGSISVTRPEPGPFGAEQIGLLETFADQAVIAIENVRLFNETKEALERQTATAEILKVISSSPTDVHPVFDAIMENALHLCDASLGTVGLYDGKHYQHVAQRGGSPEFVAWLLSGPFVPEPAYTMGQMVAERSPVHVSDYRELPAYQDRNPRAVATVELGGARTFLAVPMLKEGEVIGGITIRRTEVRPFTQKQIDLLCTFASQAVIAIENVRLFNETKEALERQTATAEILKVISSSPTNVQPVLDAIVQSAASLFECDCGILMLENEKIYLRAGGGPRATASVFADMQQHYPIPYDPEKNVASRAIAECAVVEVLDTEAPGLPPTMAAVGRVGGFRSNTIAPLLRDGVGIGAITFAFAEVGRKLKDKQLALLKTFADQAVIAIENVRLFKELQSRTEALTQSVGQLTALGEVGQAISSTLDLEKVLQTIVSHAVKLTGVDAGAIYEYDEQAEVYRLQAAENMALELVEAVRKTPIRKGDGATGRTAETLEATQVPDIQDDSYHGSRKDNLVRTGYRAVLAVPLLREDHLLGALQVFRGHPGEFAPEVVELLKTFATQSALAIQNARLFREIAEKGKQLEVASQHKSNFLASMSHELRTPLNAILGFNEMILGQVYGDVPTDMQEPLKDIQTSGKHLLRLINNVLDLAKIEAGRMELSLQDYSVHDTVASVHSTLRPLAAEKGLEFLASVPDDVPLAYGDGGRISQCLMNLAGNSLKFTKTGKVEISVETRDELLVYKVTDTGIGIPPDKIDSLFTEFKQTDATIASEYGGTGLGLSISRKFVEMHGGRIWVESELGKGSAFIIEVPLRVKTS